LTASAIARLINGGALGWNGSITIQNTVQPIARLLDAKSWHPAWRNVVSLLAGQLEDPVPLLRLLSDDSKDDRLRHRLSLASECQLELVRQRRQPAKDLSRHITTEVLDVWMSRRIRPTPEETWLPWWKRREFNPRLQNLLRSPSRDEYDEIDSSLMQRVSRPVRPAWLNTADVLLARLTESVFTVFQCLALEQIKEVAEPLRAWAENPNPQIRSAVAELIGVIRSIPARREILTLLSRLIADSSSEVRHSAIGAIELMGSEADCPEIAAALDTLIAGEIDQRIRLDAIVTARHFSHGYQCERLAHTISAHLKSNDGELRIAGLRALRHLGARGASATSISRIRSLLEDDLWEVRLASAVTLAVVDPDAPTLDNLVEVLRAKLEEIDNKSRSIREAQQKLEQKGIFTNMQIDKEVLGWATSGDVRIRATREALDSAGL
jgi:HEAT repeat protein